MSGPPEHDPYQALGPSGFRRFVTGHVVAIIGFQMQGVAVGWELYERTHSALALGLVGLGQVIPMILFSLPAGHLVDRFDRRGVLLASLAGIALAAVGLAAFSATEGPVPVYYALLFLSGAARAVFGPAKSALLPEMVPLPSFQSALAWSSGGWQVAAVLGPAIGGGLLTVTGTPALVYLSHALLALVFVALMWGVRSPTQVRLVAAPTLDSLWDGARYVIRSKILLAAITLDLFAVLLGGAVALLPVYAKDILHVSGGPDRRCSGRWRCSGLRQSSSGSHDPFCSRWRRLPSRAPPRV